MAHVGSPDVFFEGQAGPYKLLVTIRPPQVVPGVAEIEIRSLAADVTGIHIVPLRLTAPRQLAPVPDLARASKDDPQFYTGSLWLMATGSWKVRVDVDGARGKRDALGTGAGALYARARHAEDRRGDPAPARAVAGVRPGSGGGRECARGATGARHTARRRAACAARAGRCWPRRRFWAAYCGLGGEWWKSAAGDYASYVYKPLGVQASVESGNQLVLQLDDPGWLNRRTDDLLPDHNHLMHLYVIHLPGMDRVWHLHPERGEGDVFRQALPSMAAGRYALYGDIVHANGIGETVAAQIDLPEIHGGELAGDDAASAALEVKANYNPVVSELPGGYRMTLGGRRRRNPRPPAVPVPLPPAGCGGAARPPIWSCIWEWPGHAAFVATDGSVFAHVHPSGSVPMAALALAQAVNPHAEHMRWPEDCPPRCPFRMGFPSPARTVSSYR